MQDDDGPREVVIRRGWPDGRRDWREGDRDVSDRPMRFDFPRFGLFGSDD